LVAKSERVWREGLPLSTDDEESKRQLLWKENEGWEEEGKGWRISDQAQSLQPPSPGERGWNVGGRGQREDKGKEEEEETKSLLAVELAN
jgi:hypothetical protein